MTLDYEPHSSRVAWASIRNVHGARGPYPLATDSAPPILTQDTPYTDDPWHLVSHHGEDVGEGGGVEDGVFGGGGGGCEVEGGDGDAPDALSGDAPFAAGADEGFEAVAGLRRFRLIRGEGGGN